MRWVVVVALLALGACGGKEADAPDAAAPAPKAARKGGRIRIADRFEAIVPEVIHEAKMDLFVSCKQLFDNAKSAGHEMPLCYDATKRDKSAVQVVRVEHRPGSAGDAMRTIGDAVESTHFVVEGSGSMYQLLDLAYAPRREGEYRKNEIRVLVMGGKDGHAGDGDGDRLVSALAELYPAAKIETLEVGAKP